MKKKTKILAAAIIIFSLMITVQQLQPQTQPEPTDIPPVSSPMQVDRDNTPLAESKAVVADGSPEISTQNQSQDNTLIEIDFEPPATADGKEVLTESSIPRDNPTPTHAPSKNIITTKACEPQMGDTRIVNGQKQSYFLSQDDGSQGESNSINNQRLILEKYAKENGFENLKFMADDGYSGTNFNRPSFKELMLLVENGQVETIIVKDAAGIIGLKNMSA